MEVRPGGVGVAGMADAADQLPALHLLALGEARRIALQMRVIIDPAPVGRADVDGDPAAALRRNSFSTVPSAAASTGVPSGAMMSIASWTPRAARPRLGEGVGELVRP